MTAYRDKEMINRFISKMPLDWGLYIHIDKKSDLDSSDIERKTNIKIIKKKKIYWGCWEHLYVICLLIKEAFSSEQNYDYFHIVTGQDYFATNPENFDSILGNRGDNYIQCSFQIPDSRWGWKGGLEILEYTTLSSYCDTRFGFNHKLNKLISVIQDKLHLKRKLPSFQVYGGSVYSSLNRDFVKWLLDNASAKKFFYSLRNTTCAEEVFFQSMAMLYPQYKRQEKNLRYCDWSSCPAPKFLDITDLDNIIKSNSLFCRKVATEISITLLDALDKELNI